MSDYPELIFKYGKKNWFKISVVDMLSLALKNSKSEIKRMFDQKAIKIYLNKEFVKEDINLLNLLENNESN